MCPFQDEMIILNQPCLFMIVLKHLNLAGESKHLQLGLLSSEGNKLPPLCVKYSVDHAFVQGCTPVAGQPGLHTWSVSSLGEK